MKKRVDYNQIAASYHKRYMDNPLMGTTTALVALAQERSPQQALEVGCGTGRWLEELQPYSAQVIGLDPAMGMLRQAGQRQGTLRLVGGQAEHLPFPDAAFDLVLCVNALHHYYEPRAFVSEARRLLRPGGALAIVGMSLPITRDQWYIYRFFEGTYETDYRRYAAWGTVLDWLVSEGFEAATWQVVERIDHPWTGRAVLDDPFLKKETTSQLALLSDEAYAAGLARIEEALAQADAAGETPVFQVKIQLGMLVGVAIA